jgi:hypothetical protein
MFYFNLQIIRLCKIFSALWSALIGTFAERDDSYGKTLVGVRKIKPKSVDLFSHSRTNLIRRQDFKGTALSVFESEIIRPELMLGPSRSD